MAIFNEPVTVWIRSRSFEILDAASELFRRAYYYSGQEDAPSHYRDCLKHILGCTSLYEAIMALIGANVQGARPLFCAGYNLLLSIRAKYEIYAHVMGESVARKRFMISPKEFDDILIWTGASEGRGVSEGERQTIQRVKEQYAVLASAQKKDLPTTGVWAPDFPQRRPSPTTSDTRKEGTNERACSKDFDVHNAFSPGTFGAYCICKHAKIVAVIFLKQPEGCRTPLNFIVQRCLKLPSYVIYDFACGTQKAALSLSREVSETTRFVIDPFHFPGHKTCSLATHQSNFAELSGCNTESQGQRNRSIRVRQSTLRSCKDIHFMYFVILAHGYLNHKAMHMDHNDVDSTEWGSRAWVAWVRDNLL